MTSKKGIPARRGGSASVRLTRLGLAAACLMVQLAPVCSGGGKARGKEIGMAKIKAGMQKKVGTENKVLACCSCSSPVHNLQAFESHSTAYKHRTCPDTRPKSFSPNASVRKDATPPRFPDVWPLFVLAGLPHAAEDGVVRRQGPRERRGRGAP